MYYIFEAIFVGIYSCSVALILSYLFVRKFLYLLFWTGIMKHFLGYVLGIQSYYCNYGYACNAVKEREEEKEKEEKEQSDSKQTTTNKVAYNTSYHLIIECIIEGIAYVVIGTIINTLITHKILVVFFTGFILHILSEILGIHTYFCENRCYTNKYKYNYV